MDGEMTFGFQQKVEVALGILSLGAFFSFLMYDGVKQLNLAKELAKPNIAHTSNISSQHN